MILVRKGKETWVQAAVRYGALEGIDGRSVAYFYMVAIEDGFDERRAAYLALASAGVVDGVGPEGDNYAHY